MSRNQASSNTEFATEYLSRRQIPQLFEALMAGLIVNRPNNHIEYLMECLERHKNNKGTIKWDEFIEQKDNINNKSASSTKIKTTHDAFPQIKRQEKVKVDTTLSSSISVRNEHGNDEGKKDKNILHGKPIIFVSGGPGSGKGTQCEKITEKYGFTHLSAGDLIRAATHDSSTEKGRYFNLAMSQGKLISTEDILGLIKDAIHENAGKASGFLIDGFPRRIDQGIQFERDVATCDILIYFDAPDEVMAERLVKRGKTSGRIDDNEETIKKRLVTFHGETTPILGHYGKQGKLITIDANRKPNEVFEDVVHGLRPLLEQKKLVGQHNSALDKLKNKKIIFVVGGPGSGKGTQCEKIVQRYGYTHLSTGDLLREAVESKTERGEQLNALMKEGNLVPMETVIELLKENMLKNADKSKGFLIDGYPREIPQAKKFEETIAHCNLVLYVNASDETMKKRLLHRALTSGRIDDNEETIKKRLKTFHTQTVPVLDFYEKQSKLVEVNSELEPDAVFDEIRRTLDTLS